MNKITLNTKIKDIYNHPVGHDVIKKLFLQMNVSEKYIKLIGNFKLHTLQKLTTKKLDASFFEALIELLNIEKETLDRTQIKHQKQWWKEAIFYQIYPRSFYDSNKDGIGDISGIIQKLDYLQDLGINVIWLSPIYDSPNDDNGYDIRDYKKIMEEFGTMEDFDLLLSEIHKRDMKLIMDLVVNHTSDEHEWYQSAISDPNSKYRDYYHLINSDKEPNNWTSFFSGSAWKYEPSIDAWGLHLFSSKQMDLNWENENMRHEIHQMIHWWLEKGVDGFRMDVINYISKKEGLPDGNLVIGELMGYFGIEHYFYGPKLHQYLNEINEKVFKPHQAYSVGEMPGIGMEMGKLLTADYRHELDMFFSFDHLEMPGKVRFDDYVYDLNYYKQYLIDWTNHYANDCWMSLFYNNHDNPRFISKIDPTHQYHEALAKLLAMIQLTSKGTPYLFQGDEIGATNQPFTSIEQIRDVESINLYQELTRKYTKEYAFNQILAGTRDHSRIPMNWGIEAFTQGKPWIESLHFTKGVDQQINDQQSIYHFYKALIQLRKDDQILVYGDVEFLYVKTKNYLVYKRVSKENTYLIECNLSNKTLKSKVDKTAYKRILSNDEHLNDTLSPYQTNLFIRINK